MIKLQAGSTKLISNCWYTCIFYCGSYNKIQDFCTIYGEGLKLVTAEAVVRRRIVKKMFLKILQNSQENTYVRVSLGPAALLKKGTLLQAFSCEFSELFKNTFFYRTSLVAASETGKSSNCFHSCNIISNVGNCSDGLQIKHKIKRDKDLY